LNYKTYIIVNGDLEEYAKRPFIYLHEMQVIAEKKFKEKFPHIDTNTVKVSEFKGDMIDSYEPAE
jgi:hypothetical protein